jgi:short subunit dehydrogenase-like uncharacterized protein
MQLRYDKQAAEREVAIVGSCGIDSLAADLGVETIRQECEQKDLGIYRSNFFTYQSCFFRYCIN